MSESEADVSSYSDSEDGPSETDESQEEGKRGATGSVVKQRPCLIAIPSSGPSAKRTGKALSALPDRSTEDEEADDEEALKRRREQNIKALLSNSLETCRKPLLSKFLRIQESELVLKRTFKSPQPGAPAQSNELRRKLLAQRRFVPWGDSKAFTPPILAGLLPPVQPATQAPVEEPLPEGIEPLVLWEPPAGSSGGQVVVDSMLVRFLRPHQREGVQFMFDCVTGQRVESGQGCILADDMGLGKTLQGITLMWTLLRCGHELLGGAPLVRRAIIVCPTSLIGNWDSECGKWLKGQVRTLPLAESSREDVTHGITQFLHPSNPYQVLIISYETFRMHSERFQGPTACDLLICDEAHRLKNDATLTNRALDSLECRRRVLLSGTPLQNHLDEFYAMVDFCNPGVLGTPGEFRRTYEVPILAGREPGATAEVVAAGEARSTELGTIVDAFILRRTNKLLSEHLPPKVVEVVCCRMTDLQRSLYMHYLDANAARLLAGRKATGVLSAITSLKKLCNHPKLIYDALHSKAREGGGIEGFEGVQALFPPGLFDDGRPGRGGVALGWEALSGKMALVARMLHVLHTSTNDRIVIVSNYTQTLDLFATLCRERHYPFLRLDGSTSIGKRTKLVAAFNDQAQRQFVFLLSSKAGGCGLNLIGANRLILFDPDWNPANDKQAAARVWRDGQKKRVYVYRMLTTGTIEEKVFQRQVSKEGLQSVVSGRGSNAANGQAVANFLSAEELRELFSLREDTPSDTFDVICGGGGDGASPARHRSPAHGGAGGGFAAPKFKIYRPQVGKPAEEDLANWAQHSTADTVPDEVMRHIAGEEVTFVFSNQVDGKAVEEQPLRLNSVAPSGGGGGMPHRHSAPAGGARTAAALPARMSAPCQQAGLSLQQHRVRDENTPPPSARQRPPMRPLVASASAKTGRTASAPHAPLADTLSRLHSNAAATPPRNPLHALQPMWLNGTMPSPGSNSNTPDSVRRKEKGDSCLKTALSAGDTACAGEKRQRLETAVLARSNVQVDSDDDFM